MRAESVAVLGILLAGLFQVEQAPGPRSDPEPASEPEPEAPPSTAPDRPVLRETSGVWRMGNELRPGG